MLTVACQAALWWLCITLVGLAALPLAFWLLGRLPGKGIPFARPLGLLVVSYLLWLGGSLHLLPNTLTSSMVALGLLSAGSAWLAFRRGGSWPMLRTHLRRHSVWILASEALFALALLAWAYLRATSTARAMPAGGEKFMEMAFLNGVLNSSFFPALDPWLSGFSISYYYFGYVMMSVLTRLSQLPSEIAFELYDALLFAFALQLPFWLAGEMAALSGAGRLGRMAAGISAAFCTAGSGNLEGLLEALYARGWLPSGFSGWLGLPGFPPNSLPNGSFDPGGLSPIYQTNWFYQTNWWWWRASRVISDLGFDGRPLPVGPITEFPFFSFLLGDNHPHVLALPFTLLAAGIALDWSQEGRPIPLPRLAICALALGGLIFLNTWDFPILFGLAILAYLAGGYARTGETVRGQRFHQTDWTQALLRAAGLALGGALLYLPFLLSFKSQASGLLPYVFPPTRLVQYLVMFGLPVVTLLFFLPASLQAQNRTSAFPFGLKSLGAWWLRTILGCFALFSASLALAALVLVLDQLLGGGLASSVESWMGGGGIGAGVLRSWLARLADPWLFLLLTFLLVLAAAGLRGAPARASASPPDSGLIFARLLGLCGLGLTFVVEFFYLRDSFGVRMNTVFKFYFLGWVLLGCAAGYAVWWTALRSARWLRLPALALIFLLAAASLVYPVLALHARTDGYQLAPSLDTALYLRRDNPDDWAAIDWLRALSQPGTPPTILEAPCNSYCFGGRISAFSGYPAVLGWSYHEAQWRGDFATQNLRQAQIAAVYSSANAQDTLAILKEWQVVYVILGETEKAYIRERCAASGQACSPDSVDAKFQAILTPVFHQGSLTIYQVK